MNYVETEIYRDCARELIEALESLRKAQHHLSEASSHVIFSATGRGKEATIMGYKEDVESMADSISDWLIYAVPENRPEEEQAKAPSMGPEA